jgi:serine/threonine protein kinase
MKCPRCNIDAPDGARYCLHCGTPVADPGAMTQLLEDDEALAELRSVQRILTGEFEVERELGRGAMAIVFKAYEAALNRHVALKVLPPSAPVGRAVAERFKREARLAASLDHPNIIPVYRVGQVGATHFIAMKYVEGIGLDDILAAQGPLPIPVVIQVLRATASALAYAHARGIVHRDVKGANIIIDRDGRVMVTDFGIARATEDASLTATGSVMGTPYYMSPEQCAARRIGPQSDQYSLGVLAFQMLTGDVPFNAETLPGIMHHHFYTPVPDIRVARPDVPSALLGIVNRVLAKKPENRYASTESMVKAIEGVPFTPQDRNAGDDILRNLARGLPMERLTVLPLPPLAEPNRLTPSSADAVVRRERRNSWLKAGSASMVVLALGGAWTANALRKPPVAAPTRVDTVATAPDTTTRDASNERRQSTRGNTSRARSDTSATTDSTAAALRAPALLETGLVRIRVFPVDAEIIVDGRSLGRGVVLDEVLTAGQHRLRVRSPGYADFDSTLVILANETTQIRRIELRPREIAP